MDVAKETPLGEPAAAPIVHSSPGLAAFLTAVRAGKEGCRLLDLGPAAPTNFAVYSTFARAVRFVDLLRELREPRGGPPPTPALSEEVIAGLLSEVGPPYDAVFVWDALDYLGAAECRTLFERLAKCCVPGGRLFAIVTYSHTMPALPLRFEILDAERLAYLASSPDKRPSPELPPAEVEKRIAPFQVERAFLLRHGVREYVAVL